MIMQRLPRVTLSKMAGQVGMMSYDPDVRRRNVGAI